MSKMTLNLLFYIYRCVSITHENEISKNKGRNYSAMLQMMDLNELFPLREMERKTERHRQRKYVFDVT